jgi:hypothetical protein
MTANDRDWQRWQHDFGDAGTARPHENDLSRHAVRARRNLVLTWLIESAVGTGSLLLIIFALRHAASSYEAGLGLSVGIVIALVWTQRIAARRQEYASDAANSIDYLTAMRRLARRRIQLALFIWFALALELVFLIPWWIIGSRVHSRRITNIGSLLTMWIPIVGFVALLAWALRLGLRARREVGELYRVTQKYQETEKDTAIL